LQFQNSTKRNAGRANQRSAFHYRINTKSAPAMVCRTAIKSLNALGSHFNKKVSSVAVQNVLQIADHAANARRTAADSNCSPIAVNREPLTSPILFSVRMATRSQRSVDTPSANIAIARCSLTSRSSQEIPSISHLGPKIPGLMTGCES
jgi:hypothetical protein